MRIAKTVTVGVALLAAGVHGDGLDLGATETASCWAMAKTFQGGGCCDADLKDDPYKTADVDCARLRAIETVATDAKAAAAAAQARSSNVVGSWNKALYGGGTSFYQHTEDVEIGLTSFTDTTFPPAIVEDPTIGRILIYVLGGANNGTKKNGNVIALKASDGSVLWRRSGVAPTADVDATPSTRSSPLRAMMVPSSGCRAPRAGTPSRSWRWVAAHTR